jgi:Family of unknown function (DUF6551)
VTAKTKKERVERESRIQLVPIEAMTTSPAAQRRFSKPQADEYAAHMRLEALGFPVLNHRDGRWYIVDGQHRIAALRLIGFGDLDLECECFEGLSERDEARLFLERNDRKNVTPYEKFRVALTAGLEREHAINDVVQAQGLRVAKGNADGSISAVSALVQVYERGGADVLGRSLTILRDAYGSSHAALSSELIRGLGLVCQRYNGDFDDHYAVTKLGRLPLQALLAQASVLRRATARPQAECVAAAVIELMNRGRGGKKLAGWFTT